MKVSGSLKLISSRPSDGPGNMARDEALFLRAIDDPGLMPVVRIYGWRSPALTIGCLQSGQSFVHTGLTVTRRITGGRAVFHGRDLSCALIAGAGSWPHPYDQDATYRLFHEGILRGLGTMGISASFADHRTLKAAVASSLCVDTVFPCDLYRNGHKIAGSCMRRRGSVFLLQCSIHCPELAGHATAAAHALAAGLSAVLGRSLVTYRPGAWYAPSFKRLARQRYLLPAWNNNTSARSDRSRSPEQPDC